MRSASSVGVTAIVDRDRCEFRAVVVQDEGPGLTSDEHAGTSPADRL
jgi:hypothetical protein